MVLKALITAAALAGIGTMATAQDVGDVSVGIGSTNFGLSLQGEYTVSPKAGVRGLLMGGLSVEDEFEVDEATIDGEADFGGIAVIGDYYPLGNAWRISGGLFISNTEVSGIVNDDGTVYDGTIEFKNSVAPMITTGFDAELASGWSMSGDIGFIITTLEVSSDDADPIVQADIDELNDDLEDVPVFPFVGLGVNYRF